MSSKVVIFNGSPRKNGFTSKLLEEVRRGAESNGAKTINYDLNDSGIKGCQGCLYCREHDGCATKDYLQPMYKHIIEADAIVFGSPIYYHQISGQSKIWLDRTFPMVEGPNFEPRHPGKKFITVFSQGSSDRDLFTAGINHVNTFLKSYGWEHIDSILCSGCTDPNFVMPKELLEQAFNDGANLV